MKLVPSALKFRLIKVSTKGRITIPLDMRKTIGIKKGDKIIFIRKGKKVILVKPENIAQSLKGEFADIQSQSKRSLRKLWSNKRDEIWDKYVKKNDIVKAVRTSRDER